MKLASQLAEMMVNGLGRDEKMALMIDLGERLVSSLSPADRKDVMLRFLPTLMDRVFEGMDQQERADLVREMMPAVMEMMYDRSRR